MRRVHHGIVRRDHAIGLQQSIGQPAAELTGERGHLLFGNGAVVSRQVSRQLLEARTESVPQPDVPPEVRYRLRGQAAGHPADRTAGLTLPQIRGTVQILADTMARLVDRVAKNKAPPRMGGPEHGISKISRIADRAKRELDGAPGAPPERRHRDHAVEADIAGDLQSLAQQAADLLAAGTVGVGGLGIFQYALDIDAFQADGDNRIRLIAEQLDGAEPGSPAAHHLEDGLGLLTRHHRPDVSVVERHDLASGQVTHGLHFRHQRGEHHGLGDPVITVHRMTGGAAAASCSVNP